MLDRLARAGLEGKKTHPEEPERAIISGCGRSRTKASFGSGVRSLGRRLKHGSDRFETVVGDLAKSLAASRRHRSFLRLPRELARESRPQTHCRLSTPRQGVSRHQAPSWTLSLAVESPGRKKMKSCAREERRRWIKILTQKRDGDIRFGHGRLFDCQVTSTDTNHFTFAPSWLGKLCLKHETQFTSESPRLDVQNQTLSTHHIRPRS